MNIPILIAAGAMAGTGLALFSRSRRVGCWPLAVIPVAAISYVGWKHSQHPEEITAISGLEYLFFPLPPSLTALITYGIVRFVQDWLACRRQ